MRFFQAVTAYWVAILAVAAPCFAQTPEPSAYYAPGRPREGAGIRHPAGFAPPPVDLSAEQPPPPRERPTGENPPPPPYPTSSPPIQDEGNRAWLDTPILKESFLEDWGQAVAR